MEDIEDLAPPRGWPTDVAGSSSVTSSMRSVTPPRRSRPSSEVYAKQTTRRCAVCHPSIASSAIIPLAHARHECASVSLTMHRALHQRRGGRGWSARDSNGVPQNARLLAQRERRRVHGGLAGFLWCVWRCLKIPLPSCPATLPFAAAHCRLQHHTGVVR